MRYLLISSTRRPLIVSSDATNTVTFGMNNTYRHMNINIHAQHNTLMTGNDFFNRDIDIQIVGNNSIVGKNALVAGRFDEPNCVLAGPGGQKRYSLG